MITEEGGVVCIDSQLFFSWKHLKELIFLLTPLYSSPYSWLHCEFSFLFFLFLWQHIIIFSFYVPVITSPKTRDYPLLNLFIIIYHKREKERPDDTILILYSFRVRGDLLSGWVCQKKIIIKSYRTNGKRRKSVEIDYISGYICIALLVLVWSFPLFSWHLILLRGF